MSINSNQKIRCRWLGLATCLMLALVSTGCQRGAQSLSLDKQLADESLTRALEAWQQGKNPTELQQHSPAVVVGDPEWETGAKLLGFKRIGPDTDDGTNCHFTVQLELTDARGKMRKQEIVYVVGTSPVITVFRRS